MFRCLVIEYRLDDADERATQGQRPIVIERGHLPIHRDQLRRIGVSHSVQLPAAAITHIHKNAPAAEFGARVQKEGGRRECLVIPVSFVMSFSAMSWPLFHGIL